MESRARCRSTIAAKSRAERVIAGYCLDVPSARGYFTNHIVRRIRDEQIARRIHDHRKRTVQLCCGSKATIAAGSRGQTALTHNRFNIVIGDCDLANKVVTCVGDKNISEGVQKNTGRRRKQSTGSQSTVSAKSRSSAVRRHVRPDDRLNLPGSENNFTNEIVSRVRDKNVSGAVDVHSGRQLKLGLNSGSAVAQRSGRSGAADNLNGSGGRDKLTDHIVLRIRDVNIVRAIDEDSRGSV